MFTWLDYLRDVNMLSVSVRMLLAVICGGIIGIEREHKRRPAGFRTHILICLGAAMTTLTSQYLFLNLHLFTDMGRLGAQVVAGIGFIGAGSIIVTKHRRVKGLTTAAGLWTSAIIGLACGAGYYEGAVFATVLILIAEVCFSRLEYRIMKNARELHLFVEYQDTDALNRMIHHLSGLDIKILNLEITKTDADEDKHCCAIFLLQLHRKCGLDELTRDLAQMRGIISLEEL